MNNFAVQISSRFRGVTTEFNTINAAIAEVSGNITLVQAGIVTIQTSIGAATPVPVPFCLLF